MHKISPMLNRMKLVDDNLKKLFLSENVLTDHDSYLLFRGRVSKRIEDYAHLISQCNGKILECENWEEDAEEYVRQKMEEHRRNIENHKRELSVWWATHGRDYHRLCMSHFLNNRKSCVTTEHGDNNRVDANLKDTKKMMIDEINRMKNVRSELIESSQMLRKQNEIFKAFESKLRYSAQLIFSLKKRAENDGRYVWYSFFFFLSICAYIILRRLGFIRASITIVKFLLSAILYTIKICLGVFRFFKIRATEKGTSVEENPTSSLINIPVTSEL
ncbi:protein transport protein SEC20, putative (SEC20) [Plasmodium ovale wallikeri]|uniref:Protein transport protein SEC20, putative (SEC20) n=1 Tax=Plasmodium ovale wallikeri TaxID=864142 RepID=A0A1A8ZTU2_PLAOA|nr:protein transport protein SEC20, putative (SEC20) [Plasmodium ovale wallikeri]SBT47792.1 protein transport protein SEC20, putative (SEC20) [Plasmodium ovale wallikeri]